MQVSQKLAIAMTFWAALILTLVGNQGIELFSILILIGLLISRELSSVYIRISTANRLDTFIQIGIVVFIGIVMRRILTILGLL
ncbi:MAG: hypothetical protein KGY76_01590 [Candidatus Thermoplasmatota archaeon]|nr:hypothetical protein [Candidatus Thermoplasmatota archaeon]